MPPPSGSRQHQKGVWNTVILFCVLLVMTGVMFQRATTSVQRTENEIAAVTAATDAALVSGGADVRNKRAPEITSIIGNILTKAKEVIGVPEGPSEGDASAAEEEVKRGLDAEEAAQLVKTLLSRVKPALGWAATLSKDVNRFDKISHAEIHILHKLYRFLKAVDAATSGKTSSTTSGASKSANTALRKTTGGEVSDAQQRAQKHAAGLDLVELVSKGYQCSATERLQQEAIAKTIERDICSEIEWYKGALSVLCGEALLAPNSHSHFPLFFRDIVPGGSVVQLAWPEADTFIDIGANKGYLGALFLSLWGGGGLGVTPARLYETTTKLKTWAGSKVGQPWAPPHHHGVFSPPSSFLTTAFIVFRGRRTRRGFAATG